jgi:hypothetical protein
VLSFVGVPLRSALLEADFLTPLQLHHPAIVDHQLDGPIADRAERPHQLLEERSRQGIEGVQSPSCPAERVEVVVMILYTLSIRSSK